MMINATARNSTMLMRNRVDLKSVPTLPAIVNYAIAREAGALGKVPQAGKLAGLFAGRALLAAGLQECGNGVEILSGSVHASAPGGFGKKIIVEIPSHAEYLAISNGSKAYYEEIVKPALAQIGATVASEKMDTGYQYSESSRIMRAEICMPRMEIGFSTASHEGKKGVLIASFEGAGLEVALKNGRLEITAGMEGAKLYDAQPRASALSGLGMTRIVKYNDVVVDGQKLSFRDMGSEGAGLFAIGTSAYERNPVAYQGGNSRLFLESGMENEMRFESLGGSLGNGGC